MALTVRVENRESLIALSDRCDFDARLSFASEGQGCLLLLPETLRVLAELGVVLNVDLYPRAP